MSQPLFVIVSDDESGGDNSVHTAVLDEKGNQKVVTLSEATKFRQIPKEPSITIIPYTSFSAAVKQNNSKDVPFKCDLCDQKFLKPYLLRNHRVRIHKISLTIKPPIARIDARPKGSSDADKETVKQDGKTAEEARVARLEKLVVKDSAKASEIAAELDSLSKPKPKRPRYVCIKKYPCGVCGKPFASPSLLERHRSVHTGEKLYPCPHCPKKCSYTDERLRHIRMFHPEIAGIDPEKGPNGMSVFSCQTCGGKKFSTKYRYTEHLKVHLHGLFTCSICNKKYAKKDNLARHMLNHSGERKHECEVCQKRFVDPGTLKSHMQMHTGEYRYVCGVCQRRFSKKKILYEHLQRHNDEDALRTYECKVCWQSLSSSQERDDHERLHLTETFGTSGTIKKPLNLPRSVSFSQIPEKGPLIRVPQNVGAGSGTNVQTPPTGCGGNNSVTDLPSAEISSPDPIETIQFHVCQVCRRSFQSPEELQLHSRLHQSIPRPSQSDHSSYAYSNPTACHKESPVLQHQEMPSNPL